MGDTERWSFPEILQPDPREVSFDLTRALDAVVALRTEIDDDAFTASILGTERAGNGVVIRADGLVLTIGYLITEARSVWLTANSGRVVEAYPLAYDQVTGFGLVQALGTLDAPVLEAGTAKACSPGDTVYVIGQGGRAHTLRARLIYKREFAGYWEYLLDEALFTAPAHPQWGGAALIANDGRLLGVGSLLVQEAVGTDTVQCNMFVPIDVLAPILGDLLASGRSRSPSRPWLGMYTTEAEDKLVVGSVAPTGPADRAGVRARDVVLEVAGRRVDSLAALWRAVWRLGPAGTAVPLTVSRDGDTLHIELQSADRLDFLKRPSLH